MTFSEIALVDVCIPNALWSATVTPKHSVRQKVISRPPNTFVLLKCRMETSYCNHGLTLLLISFGNIQSIMITAVHSIANIFRWRSSALWPDWPPFFFKFLHKITASSRHALRPWGQRQHSLPKLSNPTEIRGIITKKIITSNSPLWHKWKHTSSYTRTHVISSFVCRHCILPRVPFFYDTMPRHWVPGSQHNNNNIIRCSFRNIRCLWVLSTSVYHLPRTVVHSSFYPLLCWPIFSS